MAKTAPAADPVAAPAAAAPAVAVAAAPVPMLRITARVNGFRRAGVAHAATPTEWPEGAFTSDQLYDLLFDPMLIVERFDGAQAEA